MESVDPSEALLLRSSEMTPRGPEVPPFGWLLCLPPKFLIFQWSFLSISYSRLPFTLQQNLTAGSIYVLWHLWPIIGKREVSSNTEHLLLSALPTKTDGQSPWLITYQSKAPLHFLNGLFEAHSLCAGGEKESTLTTFPWGRERIEAPFKETFY